ncbi:hypothetical protein BU24DRAFT_249370 [Aaosphaeria arxii CBS 175.79]|uniref:DUF7703 domain-containing protein n=1 Tax=Aaosphaeria arxii CBS 175.79 TaxID=1450172 RepID=A0A6A5XM59_9PLEO|nr:uncharacterized protein BU24DRAFT_249370 [Aaosphaeria arxii CBS 175.79]KAF2013901.1 hypothetical protein BU24DRAFT_249370 [Aaosphaeria arxii CBS 175.79]
MAGETGPVDLPLAKSMTIAAFFGISIYSSIETLFSIFHRFRTRKGLYFWSMLVACIGIPIHATAVLLRNFRLAPNVLMCVFVVLGWWMMVTGQAVVLYSRLHLVCDPKTIRWVLGMIAFNFVVLHLPVSGLYLAINIRPIDSVVHVFNVYEKVQLTGFCVQEWIIASLYIWGAKRTLEPILKFKGPREKKIIQHLIIVNLLVIAMDGTLLVTEFTNNFDIQTTYKTVVYSIKLKLEFYVLNQLLFIMQSPTRDCSISDTLLELNPCVSVPSGSTFLELNHSVSVPSRSRYTIRRPHKSDPVITTQPTLNVTSSAPNVTRGGM